MSFHLWSGFFIACWVISLSPGAGAIASMSNGLKFGFQRGYWNVIGLQIALALQIFIVSTGLGIIFAKTPWAFLLIKWFGVIYLLNLAYIQWNAPPRKMLIDNLEEEQTPIYKIILKGFIVNISNPKAIVFLLAVLPQFLDSTSTSYGTQYLMMAVTMIGVDMVVMAGYTGLASKFLKLLKSPKQQKYMNRTFAVLFSCAAGLLSFIK